MKKIIQKPLIGKPQKKVYYYIVDQCENHCMLLNNKHLFESANDALIDSIMQLHELDQIKNAEIEIHRYGFRFVDYYDKRFGNCFSLRRLTSK